jgi:hypothetical protein
MQHSLSATIVIAAFVLCWLGAVVSWFFGVYYTFKASRRYSPQYPFARFNPAAFFMPSRFTAEGNYYRVRGIYATASFLFFCGAGWFIAGTHTAT